MKANELMIGDWVNIGGDLPLYSKVTELKRDDIQVCNYWIAAKCITPIPLTSEILEKNGFEYSDGTLDYTLRNRIDYNNVWSITAFESKIKQGWCVDTSFSHLNYSESARRIINYVHELQHALRLCGLNDLADNFKV